MSPYFEDVIEIVDSSALMSFSARSTLQVNMLSDAADCSIQRSIAVRVRRNGFHLKATVYVIINGTGYASLRGNALT